MWRIHVQQRNNKSPFRPIILLINDQRNQSQSIYTRTHARCSINNNLCKTFDSKVTFHQHRVDHEHDMYVVSLIWPNCFKTVFQGRSKIWQSAVTAGIASKSLMVTLKPNKLLLQAFYHSQDCGERHLSNISAVIHHIALKLRFIGPIYSAPQRAGLED